MDDRKQIIEVLSELEVGLRAMETLVINEEHKHMTVLAACIAGNADVLQALVYRYTKKEE